MPSEEIVTNGTPSAWRTSEGENLVRDPKGRGDSRPIQSPGKHCSAPVVIERFLADNYDVPLTSGTQSLPSGHTRYTFEYAGLSYTVPSKVLYRSRLEEFDPHWSDATNHRSASYTNLPPGRYTFRVQAANNDGIWNDVGAQVQFRILPPFYRRWWFLLTLSLTLIEFSVLLYSLRVRRLQRRFDAVLAERSRIAARSTTPSRKTLWAFRFNSISCRNSLRAIAAGGHDSTEGYPQPRGMRGLSGPARASGIFAPIPRGTVSPPESLLLPSVSPLETSLSRQRSAELTAPCRPHSKRRCSKSCRRRS